MNMMKHWIFLVSALVINLTEAYTQKIDEEKMRRDIEVSENVLATLIKQEMNQQRGFFGIEIKGNYLPGYGVTFRLPNDNIAPIFIAITGTNNNGNVPVVNGSGSNYSYSYKVGDDKELVDERTRNEMKLKEAEIDRRRMNIDSVRDDLYNKMIKASKDFILDYGDFMTQLAPNEKIIITNQVENNKAWFFNSAKRIHLSVEGLKSDVTAFRQGKISREQALAKLKVVKSEAVNVKSPDMELLTSIFNRLYREDLSKTFFTEDNIYYEVLKDYGVIFYMHVFSTNQADINIPKYDMPTVGLQGIDLATRDKKVAELYPRFEQELKENILEYGRTIKSLKDEEVVLFNVTLTRCRGCGIPSTVEVSIKSNVLKDYGAGKIDKSTALSKFTVKKGVNQ